MKVLKQIVNKVPGFQTEAHFPLVENEDYIYTYNQGRFLEGYFSAGEAVESTGKE